MITKLICALATTALLAPAGFAESIDAETTTAAEKLGANKISEVSFDHGKSDLKKSEADEIRDMISQAGQAGKIHEIKVIGITLQTMYFNTMILSAN
jgi:hypothetical protein